MMFDPERFVELQKMGYQYDTLEDIDRAIDDNEHMLGEQMQSIFDIEEDLDLLNEYRSLLKLRDLTDRVQ